MFNSHIFSRFLRLVRSIRRSLFAFFVAIAMLLATFVIAPTYALSAGENTTVTEKVEGAKSGSAKNDDENKQQTKQSESINTEPDKKNTGSSSTLTNNKESKSVEKQNSDSSKVDDKAKLAEAAVKNNVEGAQKKDASAKSVKGTDRSVTEENKLPKECGGKPFKKCYVVSYYNDKSVVDNNNPVPIQRGNAITIKPKFELKSKKQPASMPNGVWFELEKYGKAPVPSWANFEKEEKGKTIKVKDTSKDKKSFDGSITLRPNGKWDYGSYKFKVFAYYKNKSEKIYATISVKVDVSDVPNDGDLTLSLYDFVNKTDKTPVSDNKITIKPKTNSQGSSGDTTGSTDNTDVYDSINNLFIDSKSTKKLGFIYHRMICKTGSGDNASYTVDSVNGLSLKDKKDNPSADMQTQFEHKEGENRPSTGAADSALYEDDKYTEESQSWISGTPTSAGTFECRVFAFKDANLIDKASGKHPSNLVYQFKKNAKTDAGKKSLFEGNIVDSNTWKTDDIKQGIDWDYKSVTIEVKSSKPPKPTIGDNDLTLKVYPFKDSTTALTSDNNKISAILGMSLKPFVDATSAADSKNKITLRVLCSKGEKKNAGSRFEQPSEQSQPTQPSGSPQSAEDLEYKTWSSNLAELGLSVPADDNQNTCHSNKEGDKTCESADPSKKVAARTDMEVSIKPTEVGNYQCVVYALKPKAFNAQSGKQTPTDIDKALAGDTSLKENKDFAAFTLNIDSVSKFTLPHTGGQSWNLQLGILAALLVNLLAAGFVVSQSERGRKLILGRWRGLCNYV
ncbi:hypothetical protein CYJ59_05590 [Gardnerella leopoldii]|uniref:LPXTG-motif protein cell wall anchor domain protein n=1 Tax=Gardnerella leopoldii TaxID=2792978 RepID=A0ABX4SFH7_9BIFI|nr:hypothetical protein [Gardnerella vaginalis]PKZ18712.1 hypothetical protein CYJ60_05585 [Gardnerella vaginalis]PKZ19864.1 hypothetical protein CYJ59_05590 [Gardnerella vaginalis]